MLYVEHVALAKPVQVGVLNAEMPLCIRTAVSFVDYAMSGKSVGVATAPVQKSVINDEAGIAFSGHTEYHQLIAGVPRVVMMLATKTLRVACHHPFAATVVPDAITSERLLHQVIHILPA